MLTLKDYNGKDCQLSNERYVLQGLGEYDERIPETHYGNGTIVRMISGCQGNPAIGYHPSKGYVTVCREGKITAEHLGFRKENVVPLD